MTERDSVASGTSTMSETANNPGGAKRAVRPWYRLHLSTWVVLVLLATVLVLVIVPGESSEWGERRRHGWPWEYLQRTTHLPPGWPPVWRQETAPGWVDRQGWAFTGDETVFSPWALVGDVLAAILLLLVVGAGFEWRRRRYPHLWQCSLRELLLFVLAVAALLAWWEVQRQRFRQEQLALRQIGERSYGSWFTYRGPKWLLKLVGHRRLGVFGWIGDHPFLWSPSEHPGVFQAVTDVRLERTDEDLERVAPYLKHLHALEGLWIIARPGGGELTDDVLRAVSSLTSLRSLSLVNTRISDAGVECLKRLPNLRELCLDNSAVTDDGMIHLAKLGDLRTLILFGTDITGAGLKHLAGLTQLEVLDISRTQVTDAGLAHLSGLTNLRELNLAGTEVTDAGLAHLSALANLRELNLAGTQVTDKGLEPMKRLANLSVLDLQSTLVTAEGVQRLQGSLPKTSIHADPRPPGSDTPRESPFAP